MEIHSAQEYVWCVHLEQVSWVTVYGSYFVMMYVSCNIPDTYVLWKHVAGNTISICEISIDYKSFVVTTAKLNHICAYDTRQDEHREEGSLSLGF
jgi:hypothetical protein